MERGAPSVIVALVTYGGAAWLASALLGPGAWPFGLVAAFFVRGASDIPLFRDGTFRPSLPIPENPNHRIKDRLNSAPYQQIRSVGSLVGQGVGLVLVIALGIGILLQLPQACSGPGPDYNPEYRAR